MTINEKHRFIFVKYLNCPSSSLFSEFIGFYDTQGKLLNLYNRNNFHVSELKEKYSKDEILLINLLYKLIKEKNDISR